jgi:flagellar assembly factor FliW
MAEPARQTVTPSAVPLRSSRFGDHDVPVDRLVIFPEGLIGFGAARRFALLDPSEPGSPFRGLVSLDRPELGFVVCDPTALWPRYADDLPLADAGSENAGGNMAVLAIVTVPVDAAEMTVDLMAPLVIDWRSRMGRQLVLDTGRYSTRHHVL